jgi:leishmanolysin
MHDELEVTLEKIPDHEVDPDNHVGDGRMLATSYGGLRLYVDYSKVSGASTQLAYMKKIMAAAVNYFFKTLQVPQLSNLKIPESQSSMCGGLTIPSMYRTTGVAADMVFFVTAESSYTGFLAWSRACKLLSTTGRPIVGQVNFNSNSLKPNGGDTAFTTDLMTVVHEMTHALGFSDSLSITGLINLKSEKLPLAVLVIPTSLLNPLPQQ